jgi:uncharacterized membrane protein
MIGFVSQYPEATQRQGDGAPASEPVMSQVVHRNIHALLEVRQQQRSSETRSDRLADAVTAFAGSMAFVYLHALVFGGWISINSGLIPGIRKFDPFPFVMLAMIASVEAIFLSTFILITQNRMQRMADRRAELDLQISLLAEHELTQAIRLIDEIARRLDTPRPAEDELKAIKQDILPQQVVAEIDKAEQRANQGDSGTP